MTAVPFAPRDTEAIWFVACQVLLGRLGDQVTITVTEAQAVPRESTIDVLVDEGTDSTTLRLRRPGGAT